MTTAELLKLAGALVVSLGGGAGLVLMLSSWLGKVWAERIMQVDRASHEKELEALRHDLLRSNDKELAEITYQLDIHKEKQLSGYGDKIKIYRLVVDLLVELISQINTFRDTGANNENIILMRHNFNRERMRAYGYLIMLAPQDVMDAYDRLIDYLLAAIYDNEKYEWKILRDHYICLANEVRKDIGIDTSSIAYNGIR